MSLLLFIWFSYILRTDYVFSYVCASVLEVQILQPRCWPIVIFTKLSSYLTEIIRAPLSVVCWNSIYTIYLFDIYICIYLAFGQHTNLVRYVISQEDCKSRLTQIAEKWERTIHSVILSKVLVMQMTTSILGSPKAKSFVSNKGDPILYHGILQTRVLGDKRRLKHTLNILVDHQVYYDR